MRAGEVLHNVLAPAGVRLDARLWRRLYGAVEALVRSRQVVLMELARQYPEATRVAAPLKALDRLLSNRRLQQARGALYGAALQRLWPRCRTVIVVDWCVLKADESLHLLRAALPVGGRALPVWDEVHGQAQLGHAEVHTAFLARLRRLLPVDSRPIVVTDAGFRMPWFRSAEALGLACIGRVRGLTQVRPVGEQDWVPVQAFVEMEDGRLLDLGLCEISKTHPQRARLVVCKRPPRGRKDPWGARPAAAQRRRAGACARGARAVGAGGLARPGGSQRRGSRARLCPAHADRGELPRPQGPAAGRGLAPCADAQGAAHGNPDPAACAGQCAGVVARSAGAAATSGPAAVGAWPGDPACRNARHLEPVADRLGTAAAWLAAG